MKLLNERRRYVYPRLLLATIAVSGILYFPVAWTIRARDGHHYGNDFAVFWSAASLAEEGDAPNAYDIARLHARETSVTPEIQVFPWHYPPQFLVMLLPLALLPYAAALAAWELVTGGLFLLACRPVVNARRWAGVSACALPAVLMALGFGQNGFLTAGLLGGGLLALDNRPVMAGGLIGLLSYKPHFAPLAFVALLAGRRWRALGAAVSSAALLALASLAVLGWDTWRAFRADLPLSAEALDDPSGWKKMPTLYAAVRLAGGGPTLARVLQVLVALSVAGAVAWLWRRGRHSEHRSAAVAIGAVVASPYAFVYDLPLAALAMGWLFRATEGQSWRLWERATVAGVALLPVAAWPLAALSGVQVGPLVLGAFFVLVLRRARETRRVGAEATLTAGGGVRLP